MDTFEFAGFTFPRRVPRLLPCTNASSNPHKYYVCSTYYAAPKPGADGCDFYLDSDFMPGLRWSWCDEVEGIGRRIDHKGWFCDDFQDQTIRGIVFRLPRGRGFLAGWSMGGHMASTLDYNVIEDEVDAARRANDMAERAAEDEREYQTKENARMQADELRDTIRSLRTERRSLIREMKQARRYCSDTDLHLPHVRNALQRRVADLRRDSAEAFERLTELLRGID